MIINNILTPYIIPLFNVLGKLGGIELQVIFLSENDKNRAWEIYQDEIQFSYKILRNFRFFIGRVDAPIYFHRGLWSELRKFRPEAICICGYHYAATWEVLFYSHYFQKRTILWAGSTLSSGSFHNSLTDWYKQLVIPRFDAYITYGTAAQEQILHYGANPEKIVLGCNTVDVKFFMSEAEKFRMQMDKIFLERFPPKNILYVGDLIPRKGIDVLIRAFEKIQLIRDGNTGLIIVGGGPERRNLISYVERHRIRNIFFENFVQKRDIVKYYAAADVFVLPSYKEVWGLVVNEAMSCGLPVVCSRYAGATRDLVVEGKNGFSFDPYDLDELVTKILQILDDDGKRKEMGIESLRIILQRNIDYYANSILQAIMLSVKDTSNRTLEP